MIFKEIQDFRKTGCPFSVMLKTTAIHRPLLMILGSFLPKTAFSSKREEFPEIPKNFTKFQEFHQIYWNSPNPTKFGEPLEFED